MSKVQCFRCDKYGHYAMKCPTRTMPQASIAHVDETLPQGDSNGFIFCSALSSHVATGHNTWIIDSGASCHIMRFREHLDNLVEETSNEKVTIGDDSSYSVKGVGTSTLQLNSGISIQLTDVLFVPRIKRNLVSISALEDKGYRIAFMDGKVLAWPKKTNIKKAQIIGVRHGCLYQLCTTSSQALIHDSSNTCEIWHRRLGRLHFRALPSMEKMVTGLPKLNQEHEGTCKGCALGKNTKGTFHKSESRSKYVLELIHSNLCGPMTVASFGGFLYYVIFIDDYSRKT